MNRERDLFLSSGKGSSRAALVRFFRTALQECSVSHPSVAYIGAANGDNEEFFRMMEELLLAAGAAKVPFVRLAGDHPDAAAARREIEAGDAVFLSGGEVYDGMAALKKTGLDDDLRQQFQRGKLFLGLSAGAIMIGRNWVNLKAVSGKANDEVFDCLGLAPTSFDAHAEDEDWIELKTLLRLQGPGAEGRAIPTGGLLRIDRKGASTDLSGRKSFLFRNVAGKIVAEKP